MLLLLCEYGLLLIQNSDLSAVLIFYGIEYANILQVQSFLDDLIGIDPARAVGQRCGRIIEIGVLFRDVPLRRYGRILNAHPSFYPVVRIEKLIHEVLNYVRWQPRCTEAHVYLRSRELLRLNLGERGNMSCYLFEVFIE